MISSNKTVLNIATWIKFNLLNYYPDNEIQNFIYLIFEHLLNYTKIDIHINSNKIISRKIENQIYEIVNDLKKISQFNIFLKRLNSMDTHSVCRQIQ